MVPRAHCSAIFLGSSTDSHRVTGMLQLNWRSVTELFDWKGRCVKCRAHVKLTSTMPCPMCSSPVEMHALFHSCTDPMRVQTDHSRLPVRTCTVSLTFTGEYKRSLAALALPNYGSWSCDLQQQQQPNKRHRAAVSTANRRAGRKAGVPLGWPPTAAAIAAATPTEHTFPWLNAPAG